MIYTIQKVGLKNQAISLFLNELKEHLKKNEDLHLYL